MASILNTSLSGLQASQRALATTSHNIANAATEGYSRQRLELGTRPPEFSGAGYTGTGVDVQDVRRVYDAFLGEEVRSGTAGEARLEVFSELSGRVGDLLGSDSGGLSRGLQSFFDSLQSLANDPASTPVRQTLLSEADSLSRRIGTIDGQLASLSSEANARIDNSVTTINGLAQAIADTNDRIASAPGAADGNFSSDLLDQRDRLLQQLSSEIEVSVVPAAMGTANVFVGNGQTLVLGNDATTLSSGEGSFGPALREVSVGGSVVTGQLSGGTLGGLLDFQREVLNPARNELGRTAVGLAEAFNAQHSEGLDLEGKAGDDFFAVGGPRVFGATGNTGTATVDASIDSAAGLTGDDYQLQFDGANYALINTRSGQDVESGTATDPLNLNADGLAIVVTGTPAAGDRFAIQPTRQAAAGFAPLVDDTDEIAAAAAATGSEPAGGVGDNRNALALLALRDTGVLEGGDRSVLQQADSLLAEVGSATAAAQTALESQSALLRSSEAALQSVSGVNLEEEAANLLRFQQAYEANARVIQIANSTFQSLLAAFR